jgi:hypothetical protein
MVDDLKPRKVIQRGLPKQAPVKQMDLSNYQPCEVTVNQRWDKIFNILDRECQMVISNKDNPLTAIFSPSHGITSIFDIKNERLQTVAHINTKL